MDTLSLYIGGVAYMPGKKECAMPLSNTGHYWIVPSSEISGLDDDILR